jgi:hypothetical protein
MAVLDWSQCPAVESNPDKLGGMGASRYADAGVLYL